MKLKTIIDTIKEGVDLLKGEDSLDKVYSSQKTHADEQAARTAFVQAQEKLFSVSSWSEISSITANFSLYDPAGVLKPNGRPELDDFIKIVLPVPALENWVRVIGLVDEEKKAEFTVRPCADPQEKDIRTEHFFTDESTSTFRVEIEGNTVTASEIGSNESINNQDAEAGGRAAINTVVGGTGWLFYQRIQWKTLTAYLVS